MTLLDVIDRVSAHEPVPFIAPIPDAESVEILTFQDNIPYRFKVRDPEPGWWEMIPNGNRAGPGRPAYPHEYLNYLGHLPRFHVITCFRLGRGTWLVVPFNASDAAQRGWHNGHPRPVHLVRGSIQPFDVIATRALAGMLLYDSVTGLEIQLTESCRRFFQDGTSVSGADQNWGNALVLVDERRKELERQAAEARRRAAKEALKAQRATLEDKIKYDLEFMGAELVDWSEAGDGVEVTWTYDGYTHTERLTRDTRLDVPGICLGHADEDYNWHNLSTLVDTIQEARRLHRWDIPREAWL